MPNTITLCRYFFQYSIVLAKWLGESASDYTWFSSRFFFPQWFSSARHRIMSTAVDECFQITDRTLDMLEILIRLISKAMKWLFCHEIVCFTLSRQTFVKGCRETRGALAIFPIEFLAQINPKSRSMVYYLIRKYQQLCLVYLVEYVCLLRIYIDRY